jgi:TonB family protein
MTRYLAIFAAATLLFGPRSSILADAYPKAFAYYAPRPFYPRLKNGMWPQGSGVFTVRIDSKTGVVTDVSIKKSTGWEILDKAAISTLRAWKFRTPSKPSADVPIDFYYQSPPQVNHTTPAEPRNTLVRLADGPMKILGGPDESQREAYTRAHPAYRQTILSHHIAVGMSADDVVASWGRPDSMHKSISRRGTHEEWIYTGVLLMGVKGTTYVYFDNGRVSNYQATQ